VTVTKETKELFEKRGRAFRIKVLIEFYGNKCMLCGQSSIWNDKPLKLQEHHEDGNNRNNNIKNVKLICPNCHSQTKHFCGRKRKGKTNSIETKHKISESLKKRRGDHTSMYGRRGKDNPLFGRKRPDISKRMSSENNPMKKPDIVAKRVDTMRKNREIKKSYQSTY